MSFRLGDKGLPIFLFWATKLSFLATSVVVTGRLQLEHWSCEPRRHQQN